MTLVGEPSMLSTKGPAPTLNAEAPRHLKRLARRRVELELLDGGASESDASARDRTDPTSGPRVDQAVAREELHLPACQPCPPTDDLSLGRRLPQ